VSLEHLLLSWYPSQRANPESINLFLVGEDDESLVTLRRVQPPPETVQPKPHTLNPKSENRTPMLYTLHPTPETLNLGFPREGDESLVTLRRVQARLAPPTQHPLQLCLQSCVKRLL